MLNKNLPRAVVGKVLFKAHGLSHLADYPPVVTGLARRFNQRTLAGNTPLGVGNSALFLAPAGGWQQYISRQHIGQATHLAATHRIGLPGNRKRTGTDLAQFAGSKVAINNGIAFISACGRLVNTLRVKSNGFVGLSEPLIKGFKLVIFKACLQRNIIHSGSFGIQYGLGKTLCMLLNIVAIAVAMTMQIMQQPSKNKMIGTRSNGQMQIGQIAGRGAAGVYNNNF